jgi:exodeoxyribonuclease V alpha subunit
MSGPTPRGAATERFRRKMGLVDDAGREPAMHAVEGDDFEPAYLGWEIARSTPGLPPDEQRALAGLAAACVASMRAGSTRVACEGDGFASALRAVGAEESLPVATGLLARARSGVPTDPVVAVVGRPGDRKPLIVEGSWLYAERMYAQEERFCARLRERVARVLPGDTRSITRALAAGASGPQKLTEEQKRAVRSALGASLALITGGPGSGKTATAVAIVRAIAWTGLPMDSVAIAAPTGKAAQRLSDAIAHGLAAASPSTPLDLADAGLRANTLVPQTLHRLLGWSPTRGRFARHENDPLPHRVVVVDEASMIDLAMMDRLLRALRDDARLILLGDADQLPSVDAGAVFRDLCAGLGALRLTKNLRVADDAGALRIVTAARAVNAGVVGGDFAASVVSRSSVDAIAFEGVELLASPWSRVADAFLERWWRTHVAPDQAFARRAERVYRRRGGAFDDEDCAELGALFAGFARSRILCATRMRGFPTGSEAVADRLVARLRTGNASARGGPRPQPFAPGTPVLVQRNDYDRGLYNGDQGVVVRVSAAGGSGWELMAVFPRRDGFEAFALDPMVDLAPAFAMTVHKAQGSEFDHVALVLPEADLPILTRELVYTAMTRARRSVVLVTEENLLACAVSRAMLRESGVADRLRSA